MLFSLLTGFLVLAGWAGGRFLGLPQPVSTGALIGRLPHRRVGHRPSRLVRAAGAPFRHRLLMMILARGAAVLGEFAEGALLLFLFSLGHSAGGKGARPGAVTPCSALAGPGSQNRPGPAGGERK